MTIDEIRTFMIQWNNRFPIDRWWRKKHGVAFLSPDHRKSSFISQLLEYEEDLLFAEAEAQKIELEKKSEYIPNIGEWLKRENSTEVIEDDIEAFRAEAAMLAKYEEN